jgi:hypothetical protein
MDTNNPSNNNIDTCKKVMQKAPPMMPMFAIKDFVGGPIMFLPWVILLIIVFIIIII